MIFQCYGPKVKDEPPKDAEMIFLLKQNQIVHEVQPGEWSLSNCAVVLKLEVWGLAPDLQENESSLFVYVSGLAWISEW